MEWHRDDQIYAVPQVEAIYTVVNDGCDGETRWKLPDGSIIAESMEANSLLLVLAGGPEHSVRLVVVARIRLFDYQHPPHYSPMPNREPRRKPNPEPLNPNSLPVGERGESWITFDYQERLDINH